MASELLIQVYRELADFFERQGEAGQRDTFLVLAADACAQMGRHDEADRLRRRLLDGNPEHLLRGYATFREASRAAVVQEYLKGLRLRYPLERAQQLLDSQYGARPSARPSDAFAIEATLPPMARPPLPPPPLPHALGSGPQPPVSASSDPYPPGLPPTSPGFDLEADLGEGLLDLPQSKGGMRVFRPEDEVDDGETLHPAGPMPPAVHGMPTLVPPSALESPHSAPTMRAPPPPAPRPAPPAPPAARQPAPPPVAPRPAPLPAVPAPPRPVQPLGSTRPTELPPQVPASEVPPMTLPPQAMPPRPPMPARPAPPLPARPAPVPQAAPRPAVPAAPAPVPPAWPEPPSAAPLAPTPYYTAPTPAAEPETRGPVIIPLLLFVLVLALGLTTAFFALVQPFVKGG